MDYQAFKNAVAQAAQAQGITEYELYYEYSEGTTVEIFQQEIGEFSSHTEGGVCFRALVEGKMGYASTEDLSEASAAALVSRAVDNASVLETEEQEFLGEGGQVYQTVERETYALPSTETIISKAMELQKALYAADPAVIDGTSSEAIATKGEIAIFNSKGLDLHYENTAFITVAVAVVSDGTEMDNDYEVKVGDPDKLELQKIAADAAASAKAKLGSDVAPTGAYPVVFAPSAVASLLGTFSSVFSAENAQKGLSKLKGKEGEQIASPGVTLVDDPFYQDSPMPMPFDAEGTPTYRKNVIEDGKFCTLLYNLKTAAVDGKKSTGNGSKGSYASSVGTSPFTMYLAPGTLTEEELLAKAGNGVYINSLGGLHAGANPISGDFSLQSAGFLIENGKKTTPVKSFTVAGNFYDLLKGITCVSDTVELPMATSQTAFGSPAILVEGLSVAGK